MGKVKTAEREREFDSYTDNVIRVVVLKRTVVFPGDEEKGLLAGGVFGDSLGTLTDGVLGQLTGQQKPDSGLDLPRSDGASLVVVGQTASFGRDALEDVIHERVHDRHSLGGNASVRVHLLQHLVDVDAVAFLSPALPLLVAGAHGFGLAGLLGSFARHFGRHVERFALKFKVK